MTFAPRVVNTTCHHHRRLHIYAISHFFNINIRLGKMRGFMSVTNEEAAFSMLIIIKLALSCADIVRKFAN